MKGLKKYIKLCRMTVSLFAAFSAATGFMLAPSAGLRELAFPFIAVCLLGCGASALNQWQEREYDARMERTRCRPLPSGNVSPARALLASVFLILSGSAVLLLHGGPVPAGLGIAAILWYNGVYTYLKKRTAFAAVPGALVGTIPPMIGWASAGGPLPDARIIPLASFFFLWQVPHFWLHLLVHGDEYGKAGLPALTGIFSARQLSRITFIWLASAAVSSLALPLFAVETSVAAYSILLSLALWLVWNGSAVLRTAESVVENRAAFRIINVYVLLVMLCVSFDKLFRERM